MFLSFCLQGAKIHQNLEKFGTLQAKCKKNVKKCKKLDENWIFPIFGEFSHPFKQNDKKI